ncbi:hypothetical protein LB450_11945 [Psychroflexus sp. CAK1W]|uniref:hypothetical protein n=1 Tax=Psychroflexus curvus TaxID=2873595 RepID=UPI001CCDE07D|nr:hypothetical protein [Psychroflexus curvus]MBZ9628816.1 hypothetical protein [Psychroflexus curvus]
MEHLSGGGWTCANASTTWGIVIGIGVVSILTGGVAAVGIGAFLAVGGAVNGAANEAFCRD